MNREKMIEAAAGGMIASVFDEKSAVTPLQVWEQSHFRALFLGYAQAALEAIEQAGFRIVPVEMTEAMLKAYYDNCCLGGDPAVTPQELYGVLIAAASEGQ